MRVTPWFRHNQLKRGMSLAVLTILLVGIQWVGLARPLRRWGEMLTQPLTRTSSAAVSWMSKPVMQLQQGYRSARRVQELETEYSRALARITELEALEQENQVLRDILQAQEKQKPVLIASPIISYGNPSISIGSNEGVQSGMPVIADDVLLGIVGQVTAHQARVQLLSQLRQSSILVETESGVQGLVRGDGRRVLLTELPADAVVRVGERIVSVGQPQIPAQLLIGTAGQVISAQSTAVQTVLIEQPRSFYELSVVEVMP